MPISCTMKSLYLVVANQDGSAAHTITATLMVNDAATALTATASTTGTVGQNVAANDLVNTVAVSAGDRVGWRITVGDTIDEGSRVSTGILCA